MSNPIQDNGAFFPLKYRVGHGAFADNQKVHFKMSDRVYFFAIRIISRIGSHEESQLPLAGFHSSISERVCRSGIAPTSLATPQLPEVVMT